MKYFRSNIPAENVYLQKTWAVVLMKRVNLIIILYLLFQIIAREYLSTERREGRADVTVHIEDINDNSPVFLRSYYQASISENPGINTLVTTVEVCILFF